LFKEEERIERSNLSDRTVVIAAILSFFGLR
jgi:hypothetical protein